MSSGSSNSVPLAALLVISTLMEFLMHCIGFDADYTSDLPYNLYREAGGNYGCGSLVARGRTNEMSISQNGSHDF